MNEDKIVYLVVDEISHAGGMSKEQSIVFASFNKKEALNECHGSRKLELIALSADDMKKQRLKALGKLTAVEKLLISEDNKPEKTVKSSHGPSVYEAFETGHVTQR